MDRAELARLLGATPERAAEPHGGAVLISERDPKRFMAAFAGAVARGGDVFLCDPNWGENEKAQLMALLGPSAPKPAEGEGGWLMIPTGGTSGKLKFARHDERTLSAAVEGFSRHFGLATVNSAGVLPLHHVSGLMAWMRGVLTGGEHRSLDWKAIEGGTFPALPVKPTGWTLSLVPTQLERLLRNPAAVAWLKSFRVIFLGGGPAWTELLDAAAAQQLPLSLGYGMTETAAMIAALKPEEFLAGHRSSGRSLPHGEVTIGEDGAVSLAGASIFRGYYPEWREGPFTTNDRGRWDEHRHLHILGRRDAVIITGGEKVDPMEVEGLLRGTGQFPDVIALGVPDKKWGQLLVAVYPGNAHPNFHEVIKATNRLADYKRPKSFIPLVGAWPANAQGKVNRTELMERVVAQLKIRR